TFMWWRAGRHNPQTRVVTNVYVRNFSLSILLWVVAAFVGGPLGLALKAAGLLIDLITPLLTIKNQAQAFPAAARKLPERFGLFVIIVLGENLVGIVNGLADAGSVDVVTLTRFVLGFLLGFGLWWIYFDYIGRLEPDSHNRWKFITWSYLHLPLVIGITMMGAMVQHAIAPQVAGAEAHGDVHSVEAGVRWLLAGGFALFYLACAGLEYTLEQTEVLIATRTIVPLRILTAGVALLLPLLPVTLSWMVVGLILLHVLHAVLGVRAWFASDNAGRTDTH
ncbi:low temperature requirement protein A, partial [Deinococcus oregonensis]